MLDPRQLWVQDARDMQGQASCLSLEGNWGRASRASRLQLRHATPCSLDQTVHLLLFVLRQLILGADRLCPQEFESELKSGAQDAEEEGKKMVDSVKESVDEKLK